MTDESAADTPHPNYNSAGAGDLPPISERQLAKLWERRASRNHQLRTDQGARVRVLYPGRPGVTAGPDFRDAVLLVEGAGLVQGDVEVHLRQRDWVAHRHQNDPNYNGVALHVALETDAVPAVTVSGVAPPVVGLQSLVAGAEPNRAEPADGLACGQTRAQLWRLLAQHGYRQPASAQQMAALLNRAGDERFLSRSALLGTWLPTQSGEQILWEAICQALGYRHNEHTMLQLAATAPIASLRNAARPLPAAERDGALTAWMLRWAGLATDDGRPSRWGAPAGFCSPLSASQWQLFRVRPANHPRRRVLGAAVLAARFLEIGLSAGLYRAAAAAKPPQLTASLAVANRGDGLPAPIGTGRARDIAINAVLPYLHAWRLASDDPVGAQGMLSLYRAFGPLPDNEITRQLASALQEPGWERVANNARRQQGLIHLQRLLAGESKPQLL